MKFVNCCTCVSLLLATSAIVLPSNLAATETGADDSAELAENRRQLPENDVSPARRINHPEDRDLVGFGFFPIRPLPVDDYRTIDGSGNNQANPDWGASHIQLRRLADSHYGDDVSSMAGDDRPSARVVSNAISAQSASMPISYRISDYLWQWGQFLDHDIDLTEGTDPPEAADIEVPSGDPHFDPTSNGGVTISFNRSIFDQSTGLSASNPRQQINEITAWIDASNVYGSDEVRAAALRKTDGSGQLKTSSGKLLPFNSAGLPNAGGASSSLFLAGDVRANEQTGLTAMHTLFVREHNRLARSIRRKNPSMTGDEIYQKARQLVGAEMQVITYKEFLPVLLGKNALSRYRGYKAKVKPDIANVFSTAAYRFGHSALSPRLLRLNRRNKEISHGHLALRDAFFSPQRIIKEGGIEPVLRGLAKQVAQNIDPFVIDDVRNFLFGPPGAGGFDLASLNIQRGRDHGLPSYNDARRALGMGAAQSFSDISSDPLIQGRLAQAYQSVEEVDLWVGGLAEDRHKKALVGKTFFKILKRQFEALRDGDRYWYKKVLSPVEIFMVERTRLSHIIRWNTKIGSELQKNVFKVPRRYVKQ
ncbi:MAG: peroxidase family protein [Pseudomonadota bacterium]